MLESCGEASCSWRTVSPSSHNSGTSSCTGPENLFFTQFSERVLGFRKVTTWSTFGSTHCQPQVYENAKQKHHLPKHWSRYESSNSKTFNKRKNRALLTVRRSQNATKYLATTVKIGNNRDCVIQSWPSAWVVRDFISHSLHSVVA